MTVPCPWVLMWSDIKEWALRFPPHRHRREKMETFILVTLPYLTLLTLIGDPHVSQLSITVKNKVLLKKQKNILE